GLESMIDVSVVNWLMRDQGWTFDPGPGVIADPLHHAKRLYEVYLNADPRYTGRVTVPVLWDRERNTVVSNESADIIRMFNSAFDEVGAAAGDYYPAPLREQVDAINARVYDTVNNGVYKAGFATTQAAYEEAVLPLFESLDWLDARLGRQRYLCGDQLTEADWRLFTTLVRFDAVYVGHFKCNLRRIADYPQLSGYLRELYQMPGIADTVNFQHIKHHYYQSHDMINPTGIVPLGPALDLQAPHGRGG
ncbi:MAG: glutathione S-transferase family protein, partial [Oxalobacteraceae bacterium]